MDFILYTEVDWLSFPCSACVRPTLAPLKVITPVTRKICEMPIDRSADACSRCGVLTPHRKRDWIAAIQKIKKCERQVFAGYIQHNHRHVYEQGVWIFGDWDKALRAAGLIQTACGSAGCGIRKQ